MRVAVTEGPGHLVKALIEALRARGDQPVLLTRTPEHPGERGWEPDAGMIDEPGLADVDAAINLYATSSRRRWTPQVREDLRKTRITGMLTMVSALEPDGRCRRFLSRSSTAFYGDRGSDPVTAATARGHGFLALATADWEAAARHAPVPAALLRTPAVLAASGGYLTARGGALRGRLGSGRQYRAWIHLSDWVDAVLLLLDGTVEGPVNLVAPRPVTEAELVRVRARAEGRRPAPPVPASLLRARFTAEAAQELWLTSIRAVPGVLDDVGFVPRFAELSEALEDVAARAPARR